MADRKRKRTHCNKGKPKKELQERAIKEDVEIEVMRRSSLACFPKLNISKILMFRTKICASVSSFESITSGLLNV